MIEVVFVTTTLLYLVILNSNDELLNVTWNVFELTLNSGSLIWYHFSSLSSDYWLFLGQDEKDIFVRKYLNMKVFNSKPNQFHAIQTIVNIGLAFGEALERSGLLIDRWSISTKRSTVTIPPFNHWTERKVNGKALNWAKCFSR